MAKVVDHSTCGPPPEKVPLDPRLVKLNREFADISPEKIQEGLPVTRPTDHRIDLKAGTKPPAAKLYRMSPAEDAEMQKQLKPFWS